MPLPLCAMALANVALGVSAAFLTERVGGVPPALRPALFIFLRLILISGAVMTAGLGGFLTPEGLTLLAVGILAVLALLGRGGRLPDVERPPRVVLALLGAVFLKVAVQAWFLAPFSGDAISYHLTKIGEWVRAGAFTREMGVDTHAPLAAGFELVEAWWVVFLRHDVLIEIAGLEFLALAAASVYGLARELGADARGAGVAAAGYALTPGLQAQAVSCMNDGPVAAVLVFSFAMVAARAPAALLLAAAGLGLGLKASFLFAFPGVLVFAWALRERPRVRANGPRWALGLASAAALIGLFWYVRNALWFGNPAHPVGSEGLLAGTGAVQIRAGPGLADAGKTLLDLVSTRVFDPNPPVSALLENAAGWGPFACAAGLPAVALSVRNPAARALIGAFAASLLSVALLVKHDPWNLRFALFFPAALWAAVGLASRERAWILVAALPALALPFVQTLRPGDLRAEDARALRELPWRERSYAKPFGAWTDAPRIAYFGLEPLSNRGESYLLYGPDFSRELIHLRSRTSRELLEEMRAAGVEELYLSRRAQASPNVVDDCVAEGTLERSGERTYRVRRR